jgi:hypothetical protein
MVMKRIFYALAVAGISVLAACSNGDYKASPDNNANGSVNPVTPLTSTQYSWSGEDPLSANINGAYWKADEAYFMMDSTFSNILVGRKGNQLIYFYLRDVWKDNLYDIGYKVPYRYIAWTDSVDGTYSAFYSNLGNSAGLKMLRNDSAGIQGLFYAKAVDAKGRVVNVSNGYFNLKK